MDEPEQYLHTFLCASPSLLQLALLPIKAECRLLCREPDCENHSLLFSSFPQLVKFLIFVCGRPSVAKPHYSRAQVYLFLKGDINHSKCKQNF